MGWVQNVSVLVGAIGGGMLGMWIVEKWAIGQKVGVCVATGFLLPWRIRCRENAFL